MFFHKNIVHLIRKFVIIDNRINKEEDFIMKKTTLVIMAAGLGWWITAQ